MPQLLKQDSNKFSRLNKLRQNPKELIENRIGFAGKDSVLSIYDTYQTCEQVALQSEGITLCGMLTGKKVVRWENQHIDFLPGQSFVMSPNQKIKIDFPDAYLESPTTCMTISLTPDRIKQVCDQLNLNTQPTKGINEWQYNHKNHLHLNLSQATQLLLERLVHLYSEDLTERDVMIELGVSELIVRMLQQQSRHFLLEQLTINPEISGIHNALSYLEQHLNQPINMDLLAQKACMSRSKFFRLFKQQLGCSPAEYQIQRRIEKAAQQLKRGASVTQACLDNGFKNASHFSRRFQQHFGQSPSGFKNTH